MIETIHSLLWSVSRFLFTFLFKQAPSSHMFASLLCFHVVQSQMVHAEDTLILKSNLVFGTRYAQYCILMYLVL